MAAIWVLLACCMCCVQLRSIGSKCNIVNQRARHGYECDLGRLLCTNIYPGLVYHDATVPQRQTGDQDPQWECSELLELIQGFGLCCKYRVCYLNLLYMSSQMTSHTNPSV